MPTDVNTPDAESPVTATPLAPSLGARIEGVDIAAGIDDAAFDRIYAAFLDRHVVSLPGQRLSADDVVAFSRRFGGVEPHIKRRFSHPDNPLVILLSNRVENGRPIGSQDGGTFWHSDVSYRERPARGTLLYAIEVPERGGDTLFADMIQAYEDLSEAAKVRLEGLEAEHDYAKADEISRAQGAKRPPLTEEERKLVPPVRHPVVRPHPETGRKALYVSPGYTRRIVGMDPAESDALLEELFAHATQERYRLLYQWQAGDVVVWDNAAVIHSATTLYDPPVGNRTLWRTVITDAA